MKFFKFQVNHPGTNSKDSHKITEGPSFGVVRRGPSRSSLLCTANRYWGEVVLLGLRGQNAVYLWESGKICSNGKVVAADSHSPCQVPDEPVALTFPALPAVGHFLPEERKGWDHHPWKSGIHRTGRRLVREPTEAIRRVEQNYPASTSDTL